MPPRPARTVLNVGTPANGRSDLTQALQDAGFAVVEADTGAEAVRNAATLRPSLVVLDLQLPDMTGFEVCCRIKAAAHGTGIPVLHLLQRAITDRCPDHPGQADAYLERPVVPAAVVAQAVRLLDAHREAMLFEGFLAVAPDAVAVIDEEGRVYRVNTRVEELFGYRPGEMLGLPVEALVPERFRGAHHRHRTVFNRNARARPMGKGSPLLGRRADGSEFAVDIALGPVETNDGVIVITAIRDVSRQRQREDDLRQHAHDLEDQDRRKDDLLLTLAHELRTPLATMKLSIDLLERPDLDQQTRARATARLERQNEHMRRLVDDLSDLGQVRSGRLTLRKALLDLSVHARIAAEACAPLIAEREHHLEIDVPAAPVRVLADGTRLVQVATNLLTNAARYTPAGGRIRLSVSRNEDTAELRVEDTGVGIPRDKLVEVFDAFARLESGKAAFPAGLGIGLSLSARLVQLHGGTLQAHSDGHGEGSEFVVRLPLAADETQPESG